MRSLKKAAALAAAVAAVALPVTPSHASADGCVSDLLRSDSPNTHVVYVDDEGRVVIDPHGADAFVDATAGTATAFVTCLV